MTEDEAKGKWCPFVRMVIGNINGDVTQITAGMDAFNRVVDNSRWAVPQGGTCVASGCMAWRGTSLGQGVCGLAGPDR